MAFSTHSSWQIDIVSVDAISEANEVSTIHLANQLGAVSFEIRI
jgi:hypothetical protein